MYTYVNYQVCEHTKCLVKRGGGGGIPILEGSRELPCNLTSFLTFLDPIGVLFYEPLDLNDSPFLCKKNRVVSITFNSSDNLT